MLSGRGAPQPADKAGKTDLRWLTDPSRFAGHHMHTASTDVEAYKITPTGSGTDFHTTPCR